VTVDKGPYSVSSTAEMEDIAEAAAEKALRKLFLTFGVNTTDPEDVIAFQDDLRHLRAWRLSTKSVSDHAIKTAIGVILTGALGWLGLILWRQQ
jgi:hypothetical protein